MGFIPRLDNYDAEADTTIRIGYQLINPWFVYDHYTKDRKSVSFHGPRTWTLYYLDGDGNFSERNTFFNYLIFFSDRSELRFKVEDNEVELPVPTDLIGEEVPLPPDRYAFTSGGLSYTSDSRKRFSGEVFFNYGDFYNGQRLEIGGSLNFRTQPWGNFGLSYTQNKVDLAEGFGSTTLHLIGPKAEISFSNAMFWTSFLQFNTQDENFNINSRFQWRYRPMSDLFIVYSENYTTDSFVTKNRGIIFKITYWLSV